MDVTRAQQQVEVAAGTLRWVPIARWDLWNRPRLAVCHVLAVNVVALVGTVVALVALPVSGRQLALAAVLIVGSVIYNEVTRRIERIRRQYAGVPYFDLSSVWMFSAALITHPALAAAVVVMVYAHPWFRIRHHPVHRRTFSAAAAVIAVQSASLLVLTVHGPFDGATRTLVCFAVAVAAGVIFLVVNTVLLAIAIALTTPNPTRQNLFAAADDYALELATIALGILLAWALSDWPVALLLIFGVSLALHRNVLIRQLRDMARTDPKTGLLNIETWRSAAQAELTNAARRRGPVGLLMMDIDHFKRINETNGHLAADEILLAVTAEITAEVRGYDLVGRFGGDEFVVLLPGSGPAATHEVAERIRHRITQLVVPHGTVLSVSIGAATYPDVPGSLADLLDAADNALLLAKGRGRDQVQFLHTRTAS